MSEQVTFQEVIPEKVYVIRCKDCAYFTKFVIDTHGEPLTTCSRWQYAETEPEAFCSRAMRRVDR